MTVRVLEGLGFPAEMCVHREELALSEEMCVYSEELASSEGCVCVHS